MSKKDGGKSKPSKAGKKKVTQAASKVSRKPLLAGVVQLATGEADGLEPLSELDPDQLHDIAFRFKSLIEDAVTLMGAEDAAKFFITATATAFGDSEELASSLDAAMRELAEPEMDVYRLKISIDDAPVKIERVIDVPDCSLGYLHEVIQDAFGWTNSHLHLFDDGRERFGPRFEDELSVNDDWQDENGVLLSDLLSESKKKPLMYVYDMGDNWVHQIRFIARNPIDKRPPCAVCQEGKGHGPPEDCGGVWGYSEMLQRLKKGKAEEFDFLDESFDANHFDLKETNTQLKRLKWKDFH